MVVNTHAYIGMLDEFLISPTENNFGDEMFF